MQDHKRPSKKWLYIVVSAFVIVLTAFGLDRRVEIPKEVVPPDQRTARSFVAMDSGGRTISNEDFRGRWLLVFFGTLKGTDFCSKAFYTISAALQRQDEPTQIVLPVFISLDPEHDTSDELARVSRDQYLRFLVASAVPGDTTSVVKGFTEPVSEQPAVGALHLIDPQSREAAQIPCTSSGAEIASIIKAALRLGEPS